MSRKTLVAVSVLLLWLGMPGPGVAFDPRPLLEHLRESYQFPPDIDLSLSDPMPSDVPGFDLLHLKMSRGATHQEEALYLSKDGRHYILGSFRDLSVHPDQERMSKIDLSQSPVRGSDSAPVTLVEYTDFQCPFCESGYDIMRHRIMPEYGGKVRWFYKSLPLTSIHPWAESAAIAAECAKRQGRQNFWKLHDAFFEHQKQINFDNVDQKIAEFVKASGMDAKKFSACYESKATRDTVNKDLAEAQSLGINGTPAFLVNGRLVSGADYDSLKQLINEDLNKKKKGS